MLVVVLFRFATQVELALALRFYLPQTLVELEQMQLDLLWLVYLVTAGLNFFLFLPEGLLLYIHQILQQQQLADLFLLLAYQMLFSLLFFAHL